MLAAYARQTKCVKELRYFGARYDFQDRGGSTALHWAMDGGNVELIDWMVEDGADINCTDYNGWTPLLRIGTSRHAIYDAAITSRHVNCLTLAHTMNPFSVQGQVSRRVRSKVGSDWSA